jgi:hypothetical protein
MKKILLLVLISFASVLLYVPRARAQATWGAISGFVSDPTGAAIPNANITATEVKTGVETKGVTDSVGLYNITHLDPGEYTVRVEAAGFKSFVQEHVLLQVDSTFRIDVKLVVGRVNQEVTVTAAPPLLKSEKTDVAQDLNRQEIDALPAFGNNITYLYETVPGVIESAWGQSQGENPGGYIQINANGAWNTSADYMIDGITDLACCFSNQMVFQPNKESVSEMKMSTTDYDPEFGNSAGLVAQFVTKSGTNGWHGSAFWANQNKATFAADPFTEKIAGTGPEGKGVGVAPFNWNEGGGSLGGPIRKNKMFIFADYQFQRQITGAAILTTVPLASERQGDFSALASAYPLYDPLTGNPDGSGRTQFSYNNVLNVIPPNRIDKVSTNLLNLLPLPNTGQNSSDPFDLNYVASGVAYFRTDQPDVRWDWNMSDKDKMFLRFTYMYSFLNNPGVFGTVAGGPPISGDAPEIVPTHDASVAFNYTHTFGPSLLAEFRAGVLRWHLEGYPPGANLESDNTVGIPNINTGSAITGGLAGFVVFGPTGGWNEGPGATTIALPRLDIINVWQGVNNWTWMHGRHQIRWGVDIRKNMEDLYTVNAHTSGYFEFNQTLTGNSDVSNSGLGTASMLLGQPSYFSRGIFNFIPHERQWRDALYVQDVWRATPKLTANIGLRWDYYGPDTTPLKFGLGNFDPDTGQVLLANLGTVSSSAGVRPYYKAFSPRLGLAYRLTDKTVIRSGFGTSYFASNYTSTFQTLSAVYPIMPTQSVSQPNLYTGLFPLEQGPPAPPTFTPPANGLLTLPDNISADYRPEYQPTESVDQWNLAAEHAFTGNLKLTVGYVGNKSTHLSWAYNLNAAPPGLGSFDSRRPLYGPFGLEQGIDNYCNCADGNYNALQIILDKRFSSGYSIRSSFTWSKQFDEEGQGYGMGDQPTNPYDRRASYGLGTIQNRDAVWILTHQWQLPYGKGLRWGSGATGIKKWVLGGWQFNGSTIVESGYPLAPSTGIATTLNADFGQRPDRIPGVPLYPAQKTAVEWYNPAAFESPQFPGQSVQCCRWGNAARGSIFGPGAIETQWAFWKEFSFSSPLNRESTLFQVRWETYNIFNHSNWGNPDMTVSDSTAGLIGDVEMPMRQMQFTLRLQF